MFALALLAEEGPNTSLAWLLWVALAFFFLMVVVGWLVSRKKKDAPEIVHEAHAQHSADDLTRIEGIGPKVAEVLKGIHIVTFADLAKAEAASVDKALDAAGLHMMGSAGWIEQAKLAAEGKWEALQRLQDELKGGRRV
jgi:hypothetical protein